MVGPGDADPTPVTRPGDPDLGPGLRAGPDPDADLRAELARYYKLVELAPDGIVILDVAEGRFTSVNPAAEQLFGMSRDELLRVGPADVSPPLQPDGRRSADASAEQVARALAGERPRFEWTHRRADGRPVACEITLLRLPSTERDLVRGSILDITDRREAERARREVAASEAARHAAEASAAQLHAMIAGLNAIVWERDPLTWQFRFVNDRIEEVLGYPVAQWLTDVGLWQRILHPDDSAAVLARVRTGIQRGGDVSLTYRVRAGDGRWVWLHHLAHVTLDGAGLASAMHSVLIDITEQKRQEQAAALLATAGRLLSGPGTVPERLGRVAELVGDLADRVTVWLRDDDGRYRPVAAVPQRDAAQVLSLAPITAPPDLERAYRAGRPFVISEVTDEMLRSAASDDDSRYSSLVRLGTRVVLVAPLIAAGQLVGLLTLIVRDAQRRYTDAELNLAGELAQRIATMVAAERMAARQRQLHEITVALSAANGVAEAAAELTAGLTRLLGASSVAVCRLDGGALLLVDQQGYPAERVEQLAVARLTAPYPFAEAARTGRPVWLHTREGWRERYPESFGEVRDGTEATVALPLLVGGRVLGTVAASFPGPRLFEDEERAFLLTLAGQAAVAFERAALADIRREMADTLQRSLLPGRLPKVDRLAVTARYLPAVEGTQAGGDWFDVLALDNGCVAVAVGDVVGNGAVAAAVMGQLRSALAGLLLAGNSPARALELLDRFADQVTGARVSTAICLLLDPATGTLSYSSAGHPPPLRVDADGGSYLDGGLGPALAVLASSHRPEASTTLPPGATVMLYTDGLVERRGSTLDDGMRRLAAATAARSGLALSGLVDGVVTEMITPVGAGDDIAVVAVRLLPAPLRVDLPALPAQLRALRRTVHSWAAAAGLAADAVDDLQLVLGEAVGNAIEHAYRDVPEPGRVRIDAEPDDGGGLLVRVTDTGSWRPPPADPGFRGRGLQIISALAGEVDLTTGPEGTTLRFRFSPPPPPVPAPGVAAGAGSGSAPDLPSAAVRATDLDGHRRLTLTGDIDLAGAAAVRDALLAEAGGERRPVLDLTRLDSLASVGIALLLEVVTRARERAGIEVILPSDGPIRRLLDLTGLSEALASGAASRPGAAGAVPDGAGTLPQGAGTLPEGAGTLPEGAQAQAQSGVG
jgi:anti-anti-sigma factor